MAEDLVFANAPKKCDALFATVCAASERGLAAHLRWAKSFDSLLLLDWGVGQLSPKMWQQVEDGLGLDAATTEPRYGGGPHVWVEGAALNHQAAVVMGIMTHAMPEHLVAPGFWNTLVLSATYYLRSGQVKMTQRAVDRMKETAFGAPSFRGGPRGDDPTVPAFLYGVVLGLDEQAARPPRPTKIELTVRSGNSRR